jgi:hypothetical protein
MTTQTSTHTDLFALSTGDLDLHFADAKIIQAVLIPTMLQWQLDGSEVPAPSGCGFFVKTQEEAPTSEFVSATFITSQVYVPGAVTVPTRTYAELAQNLSENRIDLALKESTLTLGITNSASQTQIKCITGSEFPPAMNPARS